MPGQSPLTFKEATGSPFSLTSSWQKVCTTNSATRGLLISDASQSGYDIFWTAVEAGQSAPAGSVLGAGVGLGEDFAAGP